MLKKTDWLVIGALAAVLLPFFASPRVLALYQQFNAEHGMLTSFLKFALLATFGEALGLRIQCGSYNRPGFGLLPRAVVWGLLGLAIKMAFVVFATGVPAFLAQMGMPGAPSAMRAALTWDKLLVALAISAAMNIVFAPVLMTVHKITDTHILAHGGALGGLLKPVRVGAIMAGLNWSVLWHFVFKKTIPLFWIPAHTVTFLLSPDVQVLFAALLGVALGVILALANQMGARAKAPAH